MSVSQSFSVTEVANSVSVADNTSKVNIKWTSTQTGESHNDNTRTAYYWISINGGAETKYSVSYTLPAGTTKTILNKTITVKHKDDGTGTVKVRAWMDTRISFGVTEPSKSITLTTIPRATSLDSLSCATSYFTGKLTYKYTPKSSAFYNRCNIALNLDGEYIAVRTINLGKKAAAQQTATVTLSSSELETIYKKLPSAKKGTLRFTFRTYSDSGYSKQIGDAVYKQVELTIPNDSATQPSVTMGLAPVGSLPADFNGLYVQGKTKVKATLSAEGKYGANIKSYSMKVDGTTYDSGDSYTSRYLSKYGEFTVNGYALDSRGYTGSTPKDITVIAYSKPKILDVEASRCDKDGNIVDDGTYLKIKAKRSYSPVKADEVQKNFCQIRYRYKAASAANYGSWSTILAGENLGSDQVETEALLGGALAIDTTYHVQVQAVDTIGDHAETEITVPTDTVHNHKTKNGWGFGKYCEGENLLDCAWDAHFRGEVSIGKDGVTLLNVIYPVGSIYISAVNQNPGTLFGFGTWEQIKDRFLLAAGSSYSAGSTGGEATHTLTEDEMPSHNHVLGNSTIVYVNGGAKKLDSSGNSTAADLNTNYGYTTKSTGGGEAHNNMPPYLAVYVWKRTS